MGRRCSVLSKCCLVSKCAEIARRQGSVRQLIFEPIFVDSQSLDSRLKCWSWKPQFGCRTTWSGDTSPTFCQGSLNHFLFLPLRRAIECHCRTRELSRLTFEPRFVNAKNVTFAQDHGSLDHVL